MKTRKVMEIDFNGSYYFCIYDESQRGGNPYTLFLKWWDQGWHRKKIVSYADMDSILFHLLQMKYKKAQWDLTA